MDAVALILWIMTALGGLYMAGIAMRPGRNPTGEVDTHLPSLALFGHGFLALFGLAAWTVWMAMRGDVFGWAIVGLLGLVVAGGGLMFLVWWKDRRGPEAAVAARREKLAEQSIPSAAVHLHGALATLTVIAVVVAVLGIGVGSP